MTGPYGRAHRVAGRLSLALGLLLGIATGAVRADEPARAQAREQPAARAQAEATRRIDMQTLQLQVALDRAGFSVGVIDGRPGAKTRKALAAFQQAAAAMPQGPQGTQGTKGTQAAQPASASGAYGAASAAPVTPFPGPNANAKTSAKSKTEPPVDIKASGGGQLPPFDTPPTIEYTITDADLAGPFVEEIPKELPQQGDLESLGYTSAVEQLAERFHTSPALLHALNAALEPLQAGRTIMVPNVEPMTLPESSGRRRDRGSAPSGSPANGATPNGAAPNATATGGATSGMATGAATRATSGATSAATSAASKRVGAEAAREAPAQEATTAPTFDVTVSRGRSEVTVRDSAGVVRFYGPVSSGSEHDPLPIGEWTVEGVYLLPVFFYNPELFWDADPSHAKTKIAAGPNNPVGAVWIDISRPHYGLHGTPEPANVGITQSHGCVRLTNWDALRLAAFVTEGTPVHFTP